MLLKKRIKSGLFIGMTALFLIGCSNGKPTETGFNENQLTRVDIHENTPKTGGGHTVTDFMITEKKDVDVIKESFKNIKWQPNAMVDIQAERAVEATLFHLYDKNMPERLSVYEVYLMEDGSISFQSEDTEEGYGVLSAEQAEKVTALFFKSY